MDKQLILLHPKIDTMKYYKQIKAALIVALIILICLWFYGCDSFTDTDLSKSQRIKTAVFKYVKNSYSSPFRLLCPNMGSAGYLVITNNHKLIEKPSPMTK
jgi:hypothetical protein